MFLLVVLLVLLVFVILVFVFIVILILVFVIFVVIILFVVFVLFVIFIVLFLFLILFLCHILVFIFRVTIVGCDHHMSFDSMERTSTVTLFQLPICRDPFLSELDFCTITEQRNPGLLIGRFNLLPGFFVAGA